MAQGGHHGTGVRGTLRGMENGPARPGGGVRNFHRVGGAHSSRSSLRATRLVVVVPSRRLSFPRGGAIDPNKIHACIAPARGRRPRRSVELAPRGHHRGPLRTLTAAWNDTPIDLTCLTSRRSAAVCGVGGDQVKNLTPTSGPHPYGIVARAQSTCRRNAPATASPTREVGVVVILSASPRCPTAWTPRGAARDIDGDRRCCRRAARSTPRGGHRDAAP
jgi:hypothetical protein